MSYSADDIGSRTFSITERGYDRGEVEAFLREIARQVRSNAELLAVVERLERVAKRIDPIGNQASTAAPHVAASPSSARAAEREPVEREQVSSGSAVPAQTERSSEPVAAARAPSTASVSAASPLPIPSASPAEVLDDSVPVSEQLEEARSLLDGVLDDVMGSLRPER